MILNIFDISIKFINTPEFIHNFLKISFKSTDNIKTLQYINKNNIDMELFCGKSIVYKVGNFFISKEQILIDISNVCKMFVDTKRKTVYYKLYKDDINLFINEVLLASLILMQQKIYLIHGSCIRYNYKTTIFTGWGGSGKTSLSSLVYETYNGTFICDDISIIREKQIYFNPSLLNIYDYNIKESDYFSKFKIKNNSFFEVNKVYKNIENISNINEIYFLQKVFNNKFNILNIKDEEYMIFANMLQQIVLHEIKVLHFVKRSLDACELFMEDNSFIKSFQIFNTSLLRLISSIKISKIILPYNIKSKDLKNNILERIS